jgi:hypothetical protein
MGNTGDPGRIGAVGPIGPQGPTGPQGVQGEKGEKGDPGTLAPDIDQCATRGCSQRCTDLYNAAICSCEPGYSLDADEVTCNDEDECASGHACDQICTNTVGSYTCSCQSGFNLDAGDSKSCNDKDECADGTAGCDVNNGICINTWGSSVCICNTGYNLNAVTKTCSLPATSTTFALELPFNPHLRDPTSQDKREMDQYVLIWLETILGVSPDDLANIIITYSEGSTDCVMKFDFEEEKSPADLQKLINKMDTKQGRCMLVKGKCIDFKVPPRMEAQGGPGIGVLDIHTTCDLYRKLSYCKNDGVCLENGTRAWCKCEKPYDGDRCEEDTTAINPTLLVVIIISCLLFFLIIVLFVSYEFRIKKLSKFQQNIRKTLEKHPSMMHSMEQGSISTGLSSHGGSISQLSLNNSSDSGSQTGTQSLFC